MNQEKSINWKKLLKNIFTVITVIFVIIFFYNNIKDYKELNIKIDFVFVFLAVVFFVLYKIILITLWHYITVVQKSSINYWEAFKAYLYSIPGKYVPGKAFLLLARIPPYQERGIPASKVTICFFLENAFTLLGAALLFLFSLLFVPNNLLDKYFVAVIGLIIIFFIFLHPKIINMFLGLINKMFKKQYSVDISYKHILLFVLLFSINWVVLGIGFFFLINSIYTIPLSQLLYVSGVLGLSVIIGLIAFFAPSGIGVRDSILVLGLNIIIPSKYSTIISILCRLWMSLSELLMVFVFWLYQKTRKYI